MMTTDAILATTSMVVPADGLFGPGHLGHTAHLPDPPTAMHAPSAGVVQPGITHCIQGSTGTQTCTQHPVAHTLGAEVVETQAGQVWSKNALPITMNVGNLTSADGSTKSAFVPYDHTKWSLHAGRDVPAKRPRI